MFKIIERRGWFFVLSLVLMLPGIVYMGWSLASRGTLLPVGIDFTGGTFWEIRLSEPSVPADVRQIFDAAGYTGTRVFTVDDERTFQVKFKAIEIAEKEALQSLLVQRFGEFEERSYRSIGPTMGSEVSRAAFIAVAVSALLILGYIAFAFRSVSHPVRFGICAVIAIVHDVLVTLSFICVMNLLFGWEIDALFLTAILTVIGYSVNDTIVVFDRIRENYSRRRHEGFAVIANRSIIETAQRSLGTGMTSLLSLVAILVLGGPTLQQFASILIVGIVSGTFSSIFNATALLVAWEERALFAAEPALVTGRN